MSDSVKLELGDVTVYHDVSLRLMHEDSGVPEHMDEIAHKVHELAARIAPRKTGYLSESGAVERSEDTWTVRFRANYALYVEMGHRIVDRQGRTHGFKRPEPFLRPALDAVLADTHV